MDVIVHQFNISEALPNVPRDELLKVKQYLEEEVGVTEPDDLKLVTETDLRSILKPIQARKLLEQWKNESADKVNLPSSFASSPLHQHCSNIELPISPNLNARWADSFELDFNIIPKEVTKALLKKEGPNPTSRRKFVRHAADQIQKVCRRPLKKELKIICQKIVQQYPCLGDKFFEEDVGFGYESLLRQLIYRCENTNRITIDKGSNEDSSSKEDSSSVVTPKRKQCYGTINSHPDKPFDSLKTLEEKKEKLKNIYFTNRKNTDKKEVMNLMQETYYLQRLNLNAKNDIAFFVQEWPFLLEKEGLLLHFHELVGIKADAKFKSNFQNKSKRVLDFIRGEAENPDDGTEITVLELLEAISKSLKEDLNFIIFEADSEISKREAEILENLPKTPCIIACGKRKDAENFMLSVDGIVINESSSELMDSFLMLLAAYFVFNIAYPEEACTTLEFIQRCYLGINPDRGSKRAKNNGKSKVHPKLLAFLNKISMFEWF